MSSEPFNLIDITSERQCGDCSKCCSLLPTVDVTPWNKRCQHQRHGKGCRIYPMRPIACRAFSCAWLAGADNDGLRRPDRSHCVISILPDFIEIRDDTTGAIEVYPVIEVWIDPKFPDAHRDPGLREYLARRADDGFLALIRRSPTDAFVLFAPQTNSTGEWQEHDGSSTGKEHTAAEIVERLGLKIEVADQAAIVDTIALA